MVLWLPTDIPFKSGPPSLFTCGIPTMSMKFAPDGACCSAPTGDRVGVPAGQPEQAAIGGVQSLVHETSDQAQTEAIGGKKQSRRAVAVVKWKIKVTAASAVLAARSPTTQP